MAGRIYVVESEETASLVRAVSAAKALGYVVKTGYKVRVASADDVAEFMAMGATVEDSTKDAEPDAEPDAEANPSGDAAAS